MEIADIFVVNKADRPGADRLRSELKVMLQMRSSRIRGGRDASREPRAGVLAHSPAPSTGPDATPAPAAGPSPWLPPVLTAVAPDGTGIPDVLDALDAHHEYLSSSGLLAERRRARLRARVADVVDLKVRSRLWGDAGTEAWLDTQLAALESGQTTPFDVADALLGRSARLLTGEADDLHQ
jgi:LAO/AO transport system kinase